MSLNKVLGALALALVVIFVVVGAKRHDMPNGNYMYDFEPFNDGNKPSIRLWIMAKTDGWVGWGIGPKKTMEGADLLIAGYNQTHADATKRNYGFDTFSPQNAAKPELDESQDWVVEAANYTEPWTYLQVKRALKTGDDKDIEITDSTMNVLWFYGPMGSDVAANFSEFVAHGANRGVREINLLSGSAQLFASISVVAVSALIAFAKRS